MSLDVHLKALKEAVKTLGYTEIQDLKVEGNPQALAWGIVDGGPTARVLLLALPDGSLSDTPAQDVLNHAWKLPVDTGNEPVVAIVYAAGGNRYFDLDPGAPHEIDQLPKTREIEQYKRLQREPTFRWSLDVYYRLQQGFDEFHERVYSAVRDTVDGKNDIIDETAKFLFLELFRLRHHQELIFTWNEQKLSLNDVFTPAPFEQGDKKSQMEAVEKVKAAFNTFKGHKDYVTTTSDGELPIFTADVHLKLSNPANYANLIRIFQDLPNLYDNRQRACDSQGQLVTIPQRGTLLNVAGDVLGRAFDVFLRHKFQKEGVGIYLTPAPVKRAMVELALHDIETNLEDIGKLTAREADGSPGFRACDPTSGSGGFLVVLLPLIKQLLDRINLTDSERDTLWRGMLDHSFVAADSSPRMVRLARLNLALQGAQRAKVFNLGNSLIGDQLKPCSFDLILTNPPFGTPQAKKDEERKAVAELMAHFRSDIAMGTGKKGGVLRASPAGMAMGASPDSKGVWKNDDSGVDLSVLFLDRCLQLLKPGGRLVMVVPDSLLCNKDTRYVREYLMGKKDEQTGEFHGGKAIVRAVISLPADTFKLSGTGAKTSILYVQKRRADPMDASRFIDEDQGSVFMAVADQLGYAVKNNQEVHEEGGKYIPNDLVGIVGAYRRGE